MSTEPGTANHRSNPRVHARKSALGAMGMVRWTLSRNACATWAGRCAV
ncbi:MAG TPA: hypothetical protein VGL93_23460 [Streptosporangiaceae bacterium]|jgi:hypothetical protein